MINCGIDEPLKRTTLIPDPTGRGRHFLTRASIMVRVRLATKGGSVIVRPATARDGW